MNSALKETKISIVVRANARTNEITKAKDGSLILRTTATPEKGKANKAIITLLSASLGLAKQAITILYGKTSSKKIVVIKGLTQEEIYSRLSKNSANIS